MTVQNKPDDDDDGLYDRAAPSQQKQQLFIKWFIRENTSFHLFVIFYCVVVESFTYENNKNIFFFTHFSELVGKPLTLNAQSCPLVDRKQLICKLPYYDHVADHSNVHAKQLAKHSGSLSSNHMTTPSAVIEAT